MMKLMAAEVLARRAGDTVTGAGGCARSLGGGGEREGKVWREGRWGEGREGEKGGKRRRDGREGWKGGGREGEGRGTGGGREGEGRGKGGGRMGEGGKRTGRGRSQFQKLCLFPVPHQPCLARKVTG